MNVESARPQAPQFINAVEEGEPSDVLEKNVSSFAPSFCSASVLLSEMSWTEARRGATRKRQLTYPAVDERKRNNFCL